MRGLYLGLAAAPLLIGFAWAAEPLKDPQMDALTAGFSSVSIADAQALGKVVATATATLAEVGPVLGAGNVTISLSQTVRAPLGSLPGAQWTAGLFPY